MLVAKKKSPWNKGLKKETDERVARGGRAISKVLTGRKLPEERRKQNSKLMVERWKDSEYKERVSRKISDAHRGKIRVLREIRACANFDCNITFEIMVTSKKKYCCVSCANKVNTKDKVRNKKIRDSKKGVKLGPRSVETIEKALVTRRETAKKNGYYFLEETKEKIGFSNQRNWMDSNFVKDHTGENANNWQGGISSLPYPFDFNEKLKNLIRERDNYTCQLCGKTEKEEDKKLSVHHIDYIKENLDPENLITLCGSCNSRVNGSRKSWIRFFQLKLRVRRAE